MISHLMIPTFGRPDLLGRVLDSLMECELPESLQTILIVENGPQSGAEPLCKQMSHQLPLRYLWSEKPCKSLALNLGLAEFADDDLVIMSDDDVRFEPQTLLAYDREARRAPTGWFFGGPFEADFEQAPPEWVLPYLPPSARGWTPRVEQFNSRRDRFFGCNWAVFARDLRAAGTFDLRFGPGTEKNATGEETEMQRRLHRQGLQSRLVNDARVWHHVPADRCSPEWALARSRRNGLARGIANRTRGLGRMVINHTLNVIRYSTASAKGALTSRDNEQSQFHAQYNRNKAAGYFEGYYSKDASRAA